MAPSQNTNVLLGTVVLYPYQSQQSSEAGYLQERSHNDSAQSKEPVASVTNPCNTSRNDKQVAQVTGIDFN